MSDFYQPCSVSEARRHVDQGVYASRYQKEKNLCVDRLLERVDLKGRSVLEIGCGAGFWTERLLARGALVTAIDVRPHLVEAARSRILNAPYVNQVDFHCGQLEQVIEPKPLFDHVFFKDVIEHIDDDLGLLRAITNRMAPGATMLIATHNAWSLNFLIEGAWERLVKRNKNWIGWDPTHVRFYTPRSLRRVTAAAGLTPIHVNACYHIPYRFFLSRIGLSRLEPSFLHVLDHKSDDNLLARFGWSIQWLLQKDESKAGAGRDDTRSC